MNGVVRRMLVGMPSAGTLRLATVGAASPAILANASSRASICESVVTSSVGTISCSYGWRSEECKAFSSTVDVGIDEKADFLGTEMTDSHGYVYRENKESWRFTKNGARLLRYDLVLVIGYVP